MESTTTTAKLDKDPLAVWLERQFADKINGLNVERLVLSHLDISERHDHMEGWPVTQRSPEAALIHAEEARYRARQDADMRGGMQRYALQVHWPLEANTQPRYHMFAIDGNDLSRSASGMHGATEPATSDGIVKQLMRHNEMLMRMATKQTVDIQDETRRREERLLQRIDQLEHGRFRVVELTESLLSAQVEREAERNRQEAQERRKDLALKEFVDVVGLAKPKLLQAVFKQDGAGSAADQQMLRMLFEGMSIDQLKAMQASLPTRAQQQQFAELYTHVMNLKKSEDKKPESAKAEDGASH